MVSTAPAKLFGLYPKKGTIAAGSDADIIVWNPEREQSLDCKALHMRVDYSPYEGKVVRGSPSHVLSRQGHRRKMADSFGRSGDGRFVRRSTFSPL